MSNPNAIRNYFDGKVLAAYTRDAGKWGGDMPPEAYTIVLDVSTEAGRTARVFLEVSTRPGRSDYTRDRQQWQLALDSLRKIDPGATENTLANPGALVGMNCRVMSVAGYPGAKVRWYLVNKGNPAEGADGADKAPDAPVDAAGRLAAMLGGSRRGRAGGAVGTVSAVSAVSQPAGSPGLDRPWTPPPPPKEVAMPPAGDEYWR